MLNEVELLKFLVVVRNSGKTILLPNMLKWKFNAIEVTDTNYLNENDFC